MSAAEPPTAVAATRRLQQQGGAAAAEGSESEGLRRKKSREEKDALCDKFVNEGFSQVGLSLLACVALMLSPKGKSATALHWPATHALACDWGPASRTCLLPLLRASSFCLFCGLADQWDQHL